MESNTKSSISARLLGLFIGLSTCISPALAETLTIPVVPLTPDSPIFEAPLLPPIPVPYPNCPTGFTLAQRGAHVFHCRATVNPINSTDVMQVAQSTRCSPSSYWSGPSVYQSAHNGHLTVNFKCQH